MTEPRILRFYLDDGMRQSAEAGQHNFIRKVSDVMLRSGYRVEYRKNTAAERLKSATRRGYAMFHMDAPFHPRSLTFRLVYRAEQPALERVCRAVRVRSVGGPPEKSGPFLCVLAGPLV